MNINRSLLKSTIVAALGGLLFGFDTAVIAGVTQQLTTTFHLTPALLGITVASALWGTTIGAIFAGIPGDVYGRRDSLRVMAVLYLISALGCAFAWDWYSLVFFRFLAAWRLGVHRCWARCISLKSRLQSGAGVWSVSFSSTLCSGFLFAYLSNFVIGTMALGATEWRWKLGISAVPAALFFLMLFGIPRSPRWLATQETAWTKPAMCCTMTGEEDYQQELRTSSSPSMPDHGHPAGRCSRQVQVTHFPGRIASARSTSSRASTPFFIT